MVVRNYNRWIFLRLLFCFVLLVCCCCCCCFGLVFVFVLSMLLVVYVAADRRPKSILYFNFNFQHVIKDTAKTNRVKPRIGALDIHGYEMLGVRSSFSFCFE